MNGDNEHKLWSEYYSEMFSVEILNNLAVSLVVPIATKALFTYSGVPEHLINGNNYLPRLVAEITDSPFAQGLLQATVIEVSMLAIDGVGLAGKTIYDQMDSEIA